MTGQQVSKVKFSTLQEMSKTHEAISKAKTQTSHRVLTHYLPLYFPDRALRRQQPIRLVPGPAGAVPDPASMTSIGQQAFTQEAWDLVGRKVSKARLLNDIYETACASVALPV